MPWAVVVRGERMERREAGQACGPLVDLGVVLHRARAERVEPRVDRVVELREVDVVADDLGLVELRQRRRRRAAVRGRDPVERVLRRMRDLVAAAAGPGALEQRRLEPRSPTTLIGSLLPDGDAVVRCDGGNRRRPARTSSADANRAISSLVVTSVAHTSSASARVGSSGSASASDEAGEDAAVEQAAMDRRARRARGPRTR